MPHALWPKSAAARALVRAAGHCWSVPPQETLKPSKAGLAQSVSEGSLGSGVHKILFELSEHLWRIWGLILNMISPLVRKGVLLCPCTWIIFFGGIQHSPVDGFSAVSCNLGVLPGEDERTSFYYTILLVRLAYLPCCYKTEPDLLWVSRSLRWRPGSTVSRCRVRGSEYNSACFEGGCHYLHYPYLVWPQAKQQGGNTAPLINRKLD